MYNEGRVRQTQVWSYLLFLEIYILVVVVNHNGVEDGMIGSGGCESGVINEKMVMSCWKRV
jgi:hypothetical protein